MLIAVVYNDKANKITRNFNNTNSQNIYEQDLEDAIEIDYLNDVYLVHYDEDMTQITQVTEVDTRYDLEDSFFLEF